MPFDPAALQDLRQALRGLGAQHSGAVVPSAAGKALEVWVLMKLALAARAAGWTVTLRRGDGTLLPAGAPFGLPKGQGPIGPSNSTGPGFVLLEPSNFRPAPRLEMHVGLQWKGRSGATHECDVSALPAVIGGALRRLGGGHPRGLPIVAIECKDRATGGDLDETRQTLARLYDLVLVTQPSRGWNCRIYEDRGNHTWGCRNSNYRMAYRKGLFGIVRAGRFRSGARNLADHYYVKHYPDIYAHPPGNASMKEMLKHFQRALNKVSTL